MPNVNLSDIQAAADAKYGPYVIEGVPGGDVSLISVLRLDKDKRKQFIQIAKSLEKLDVDNFDEDQLQQFENGLRMIARTKAEGDRLIKALGGDLAMAVEIYSGYVEASQPGEATPSQS